MRTIIISFLVGVTVFIVTSLYHMARAERIIRRFNAPGPSVMPLPPIFDMEDPERTYPQRPRYPPIVDDHFAGARWGSTIVDKDGVWKVHESWGPEGLKLHKVLIHRADKTATITTENLPGDPQCPNSAT